MVTKNPMFMEWSFKKFQATVVNDIWPETLFFSLVAAMVALVSDKTGHNLGIADTMFTVFGLVLGLVVSFRTSSAYERYSEGTKLWTNIGLTSRNLAQTIWIHVPNDRKKKKAATEETGIMEVPVGQARLKSVIEKKSMINLIQAFSVAVKHALRGEAGIYYEDLYPLICFLPRFASKPPRVDINTDVLPLWQASSLDDPNSSSVSTMTGHTLARTASAPGDAKEMKEAKGMVSGDMFAPDLTTAKHKKQHSDPDHILPVVSCDRKLGPSRNPPKSTLYDYIPLLIIFKPLIWCLRYVYRKIRSNKYKTARPESTGTRDAFGRKRKPVIIESSVPLEITLFLSSYLSYLIREELIAPTLVGTLASGISTLQDTMANLERIRTSPIPFAYQAHLRVSMWLYLFFLPFEIYNDFGYLTIPATAFGAFLLLGFLEIGQEIEDPFGYDANDLDLDYFCFMIQRELSEITAHTSPEPNTYCFEDWNHPFAPGDMRSAKHMLDDVEHDYHGPDTGMLSIRRTLLMSWRSTVQQTAKHHTV